MKNVFIKKRARKTIEMGWTQMENKYTSDVYSNPRLVKNIYHTGGCYIKIHCNGGNRRIEKKDPLKGYGTVWFDEGGITNILYFIRIRENYPACYDTEGN